MSSPNVTVEPASRPYTEYAGGDLKVFCAVTKLLESRTRRQAAVDRSPGTSAKAALVLLASVLLNTGLDAGRELVSAVELIIWTTLCEVEAAPNLQEAIARVKAEFAPKSGEMPLQVHRTTVEGMVPALTRGEMDEVIKKQYLAQMVERKENHAQSPKVTLVFDSTSERVAAAHPNGTFSYVKPGGQAAWVPGFRYASTYDATHQLFVGSCHKGPSYASTNDLKSLPPVVQEMREKVATVAESGSAVAVIEADREYFKGEIFAAASTGLLCPKSETGETGPQPRVVIPRKFGPEKQKFTWEYLVNGEQGQVFKDSTSVAATPGSTLGKACEGTFEQKGEGEYLVPYACVALVGEWGQSVVKDLAGARARAKEVQAGIESGEKALEVAEDAYIAHYKVVEGKNRSKPGYGKGARRSKFSDMDDERLYKECFRLHGALNQWIEKKISLIVAIAFIAVSLRPGEDPTGHPNIFVQLAREYHSRWGVENGFRDVKGEFLRKMRSAKPTRRQFNFMLGMLLYNWWHNVRWREMLESWRTTAWNKVGWDPHRPWVRRKLEQEIGGISSARSFLIRTWANGAKYLIQKIFKGI